MDIMNRVSNMFNYDCEAVFLYNINYRLNLLIEGIWSIRDLESKVFQDWSEPLGHFGGQL